MSEASVVVATPITVVERAVLENHIAKLREELTAANVRATVAELEKAAQSVVLKGHLTAALNLGNSDKSAVLMAVAAYENLEAEHKQLFDKARAVADTYGVNSVDFHRAISHLRAFVGQL